MDVPFEICDEHTLYCSSENEFDSLQVKLHFEKPCHRNQIEEHFEDYHVFYDPVTDYLEKQISWDSWLCFFYKYQVHYHSFLPLCFSVLTLIKHDEEAQLLDQLLDWIH